MRTIKLFLSGYIGKFLNLKSSFPNLNVDKEWNMSKRKGKLRLDCLKLGLAQQSQSFCPRVRKSG